MGRRRRSPSATGTAGTGSARRPARAPEAAADRALVFDVSERVREVIQDKVYENLVKRGGAFL